MNVFTLPRLHVCHNNVTNRICNNTYVADFDRFIDEYMYFLRNTKDPKLGTRFLKQNELGINIQHIKHKFE